jgi:hypothetical protein
MTERFNVYLDEDDGVKNEVVVAAYYDEAIALLREAIPHVCDRICTTAFANGGPRHQPLCERMAKAISN